MAQESAENVSVLKCPAVSHATVGHTGVDQETEIAEGVTGCAAAVAAAAETIGAEEGTMAVQDAAVHAAVVEAAMGWAAGRGAHLRTGPCPAADLHQEAR